MNQEFEGVERKGQSLGEGRLGNDDNYFENTQRLTNLGFTPEQIAMISEISPNLDCVVNSISILRRNYCPDDKVAVFKSGDNFMIFHPEETCGQTGVKGRDFFDKACQGLPKFFKREILDSPSNDIEKAIEEARYAYMLVKKFETPDKINEFIGYCSRSPKNTPEGGDLSSRIQDFEDNFHPDDSLSRAGKLACAYLDFMSECKYMPQFFRDMIDSGEYYKFRNYQDFYRDAKLAAQVAEEIIKPKKINGDSAFDGVKCYTDDWDSTVLMYAREYAASEEFKENHKDREARLKNRERLQKWICGEREKP